MWNVLTWKLVVVAFGSKTFPISHDVMDAVLSTVNEEQRTCGILIKFLIRQLVALKNKTKIICSMTAENSSLPMVWKSRLWLVTQLLKY